MAKSPKISVIITSYNSSGLVAKAIKSVLRQTCQNFEIIVVDDGSTDTSLDQIETLRKKHPDLIFLHTHNNHHNRGILASYQLGISKSKGEYVAFLEHDDTWAPNYLERKVKIFYTFPEVNVIFSPYRVISKNWFGWDMILRQWLLRMAFVKEKPFDNFNHLLKSNNIATFSCFTVRKNALNSVPSPPDESALAYDWWIVAHLGAQSLFYSDSRSYTNWRWSRNSAIGSGKFKINRERGLKFMEMMYESLNHHSDLLDEAKRRIFFEHKKTFLYFLNFYKNPQTISFLRFFKLNPLWASASLASIIINYLKFR